MDALDKILNIVGSAAELVARCKMKTTMSITQWRRRGIPVERVIELSRITDYQVTPHQIDPVHYPHPEDGLPVEKRRQTA